MNAEETVAAPDSATTSPRLRSAMLDHGALVGRYVVMSRVGAGAMGVVYAAYDPELDRKVALKLLHAAENGRDVPGHRGLLREAQAMAKLNHPNAITVHDVGEHDGRVYLAMEFVEGSTLRAWLEAGARTWQEVLDVFVAAGRGLVAAHEQGLVHGDFKPDNVMLGSDGATRGAQPNVRVMDFGLARPSESDEDRARSVLGDLAFDATGVGTPAYMAPEQHLGQHVGPAADQFAFCVAVWEAVYRERPFSGQSLPDLAAQVVEGSRRPRPRGIRVPRWFRAVIERGLAVGPEDRWPSLASLLEALDRGRARARLSVAVAAVGGVALLGAGVFGLLHLDEQRRIATCETTGAAIDEVWNDEAETAVRAGLLATGASHTATTADKLMPWLDAYAAEWRSARIDACMDAEVRETWDPDTLARSVWCLDDRRFALEALVAELRAADRDAERNAVNAAAALRRLAPCRDRALLERSPAPPASARDELRAVRAELSRARVLETTGAYAEGLASARATLQRAEALGWPPLVVAARHQVGRMLEVTGAFDDAEATAESAYFEAVQVGASEEAVWAAESLVMIVGVRLARQADGERWSRHAAAHSSTLPDPGGLREATHLTNLAILRKLAGAYSEAAALQQQALQIEEATLGPAHPDVAQSLSNLGNVRARIGAYEEASELHERALRIWEAVLGPEHPHLGGALTNLANARWSMGAREEAAGFYERALRIMERSLGADHPDVAIGINNLAGVHYQARAFDEAAELYERALAIREKALGPEHPEVAITLNNLAAARWELGQHDEAAELYERALHLHEQTLGPEHPELAMILANLGRVRLANGDYDEATELYERALDIREQTLGTEHRGVAHPLVGLAKVALAQDRSAEAVRLAERALKLCERGPVEPLELAEARLLLARALLQDGGASPRMITLAQQARDAYRDGGEAQLLAEAEALLRTAR